MPWRREETAPYHFEDVYVPAAREQFTPYGEPLPRTAEEMDAAYERAMAARERDSRRAAERPAQPVWVPPQFR